MDKTYTLEVKITSNTGVEVLCATLKELSEDTVDKFRRDVMKASMPL